MPAGAGAPITLTISITNHSNGVVPVVFRSLAPPLGDAMSIRDARGHDVARVVECGSGFSGSGSNYMVVLPPGGVAAWDFPYNAATRVIDRQCNVTLRPFAPGTYDVSTPVPVVQLPNAIARGTLRVQ
jgi:hypothetical protein